MRSVRDLAIQQEPARRRSRSWGLHDYPASAQYFIAIAVVLAITLLASLFESRIGGPHAAALIYLLAVVMLGSSVRRGPTLMAAAMSALLWDYFMFPPVYAFRVTHVEDALLLGMYFIIALILGQFTTRNREQQEAERLQEERATALYNLSRELNEVTRPDEIVHRAIHQMKQAFKAQIAIFLRDTPTRLAASAHVASTFIPRPDDRRAIESAFQYCKRTGKFTGSSPQADALFVPLRTSEGSVGVIGVRLNQTTAPTIYQLNLLESFSQQIAVALDRYHMREVAERTKLLAESERLSKTLLNSMSHEMRTPIAVINSAVSNLIQLKTHDSPDQRAQIMLAIQSATGRLNRLVGNVLDMTRLESGHVKPRFSECDVTDLINVSIEQSENELANHKVIVKLAPNLPIVSMDFVLMEQALVNLLSNAAVHTPPGTQVKLTARAESDFLVITVADNGAGIPPASLKRIFEKFYRDPHAPTGGTGLGLSLVRGFVEAQGGDVKAANQPSGGAVFTIRLPRGSVPTVSRETSL